MAIGPLTRRRATFFAWKSRDLFSAHISSGLFPIFIRMKCTAGFLVFVFFSLQVFGQTDPAGSGRAVKFDGIDDYIDLGNIFDDLEFPITVSAWIFIEPNTQYILPVLVSQDNAPLYNGFWFCLSQTNLFFEYGDGGGEQNPAFRRGKSARIQNPAGRWIYISAVIRGADDIQLYANGHNVGGAYTGSSTKPMASNYPEDVAKIGYLYTNSVTHRFKGMIDELRVWKRARSQQEIRETMCQRLKGNEPDLIGYWNFDETEGEILKDLSVNKYDGVLRGNPVRVFSGAPVGDESIFLYTGDWADKSLSKDDLSVSDVSPNTYGVHIYSVNHIPSQTGGLDVSEIQTPYYGVFLADDGAGNTFDLSFAGKNVCSYYKRNDNSEAAWEFSESFADIVQRIEIIPSFEGSDLDINLGADITLCDEESFLLEAHADPSGKTFLWSSGETTPTITLTSSGRFSVEVKQDCLLDKDTIEVTFLNSPPAFSLGEDERLCTMEPRMLSINLDDDDYEFMWQNGAVEKSFEAMDFGTYWLKLQNACGISIDSITFSRTVVSDIAYYNFISPGNHDDLNQFFTLDEKLLGAHLTVFNRWGKPVYASLHYQNDWDGGTLPAGVYYYTLQSPCIETYKGSLTIFR